MNKIKGVLGKLRTGYLRYITLAVLLCLSVLAITIAPGQMNLDEAKGAGIVGLTSLLSMEQQDVGIAHLAAVILLWLLFNRYLLRDRLPFEATAAWVSCILSIFLICGMSLSAFHDLSFLFGRKVQFIIAAAVFAGIWVIIYTVIKAFYNTLDRRKTVRNSQLLSKIEGFFADRFLLKVFFALVIAWLIQAIPFFPGSVPHDGRYQLNQFFGYQRLNIHHPYYSTMLMGFIYKVGSKLFGHNGGCVFFVLFQCFWGAAVFARICDYIRRKTGSTLFWFGCVLFYMFAPMWWTYFQTIHKDTISFIVLSWFTFEYIYILLEEKLTKYNYIMLVAAGVLSCLFRHDSKYIIFPAMLVLLMIGSQKFRILFSGVSLALLFVLLNSYPEHYLGLTSDNNLEALSIPMQQMGRYVTLYGDELTDEEKEIIDTVFDLEKIPEVYDPELADKIKSLRRGAPEEDVKAFLSLWLEKLRERPGVFITATLNNVFGYTDPFYFYKGMGRFQLYTKGALGEDDEDVVYSEYLLPEGCRTAAMNILDAWDNTPYLCLIINSGTYTWIGFVLLGAVLRRRRWDYALSFCIPVLLTLICFASPVNGLLRYSLAVMAITPLYIMLAYLPYYKSTSEVNTEERIGTHHAEPC
ncbi:MAG: hypothetical protein IJS22_06760 [Lachnospiraceae bacterium]|nr:hypothetical protein [Lachnospiraceae bacterium]